LGVGSPISSVDSDRRAGHGERAMGEIIRSGTIVLMGVIVMAAGVFVVFYG
jgi:hypothetical protein